MSDHRIVAEIDTYPDLVRVSIHCDHGDEGRYWSEEYGECFVAQWFEAIQWEAFTWASDVEPFTDLALPAKIDVEPNGDDGWIIRPA